MNRIYYIFIIGLLSLACSEEDELTPSGIKEDFFTEPSYASPEDLQLISKFYANHGVHLLFNDTLRHEQRGVYADGTPRWYTETIDLSYSLNTSSGTYRSTCLTEQTDKAHAITLTENYILSHLGEGMKPYSIFLASKLESYNSYRDRWSELNFINGYRCLAINAGALLALEEDEQQSSCLSILQSILLTSLNNNNSLLQPFTDPVEKYYDAYWDDGYAEFYDDFKERKDKYNELDDNVYYAEEDLWDAEEAYENGDITEEELKKAEKAYEEAVKVYEEYQPEWMAYCEHIAHECGFIWFNSSGSIRLERYDLQDYITAVFYTDEEEFMETYKDYPLVQERYNILKKIILDLGFIF